MRVGSIAQLSDYRPVVTMMPAKPLDATRHFIDHDEGGVWYVVPLLMRKAWDRWKTSNEPQSPSYARSITHPRYITFSDPKLDTDL